MPTSSMGRSHRVGQVGDRSVETGEHQDFDECVLGEKDAELRPKFVGHAAFVVQRVAELNEKTSAPLTGGVLDRPQLISHPKAAPRGCPLLAEGCPRGDQNQWPLSGTLPTLSQQCQASAP